jgi:hypothetical protein
MARLCPRVGVVVASLSTAITRLRNCFFVVVILRGVFAWGASFSDFSCLASSLMVFFFGHIQQASGPGLLESFSLGVRIIQSKAAGVFPLPFWVEHSGVGI